METVEKSIEVNAPVSTVYNQWTQFEQFPEFMEGVEHVKQLDDKRLHWKASVAGKVKEWEAEIFEQIPDQRIAWRSISGAPNSGAVSFFPVGEGATRVTLSMNYQPETVTEKIGDSLGIMSMRVNGDLKRFKEFIESRGAETGGWRGEIRGGQTTSRSSEPLKTAVEAAQSPRSKRIRAVPKEKS